MALFGAPTAHEDDPERAVRAALAIRDFAAERTSSSVSGSCTGEALVRSGCATRRGEGMVSWYVVYMPRPCRRWTC